MSQLPDGYRVELDAYAGPMDLLEPGIVLLGSSSTHSPRSARG